MFTPSLVVVALAAVPQECSLKDPGFELATLDASWERVVYGAPATIESDATIHHGGARSLAISACEPSDAALGQEVTLEPAAWYRFHGFVRTQGVDPKDAPTCGTFQIQRPRGAGILAAGRSHRGDCDWSEVVLPFQTPADGRVRIALFLVGFGKGTGRAWFDDLSLERFDPGRAPIRVTRTPLIDSAPKAAISPMQCGQFIEFLCDLVPGMWAERLCDGGFEGLSPYRFEYLRETDFREHPWVPFGATGRAELATDHGVKVAGDSSQRIRITGDAPCSAGVEQRGLFVERGKPCTFKCWLRRDAPNSASGAASSVRVRIRADGRDCACCEFKPTAEWAEYSAHLDPRATDADATLAIEFAGPGTLWIDNASLMPFDNVLGWRPDVVAALKLLDPAVIRFGGSALEVESFGDFEWRDVVGPVTKRRPLRAWGGLQPFGAGLEEIVQLCRVVAADPLICVRVTCRPPKDAADEVEYFNGSKETPMGARRAANGHPEPYDVSLWQVGNELAGPDYEARLPEFCKAMKAVDPSIELLSAYPTPGVVAGAGAWLDYVCPHDYGCDDLLGKQQQFDAIRALLHEKAPTRSIHVAVTEWNTTAGDAGPKRAKLWTLANALACARYHNLLHRNCDLVTIANRSNLTNSFCSGILQTDNHRLYRTPTYWTQWLYAHCAGTQPLKLDSKLPTDLVPDLSATLSADGRKLTIFAVNDSREPVTRTLDLTEFAPDAAEVGAPSGPAASDPKAPRLGLEVSTLADADAAGDPDVTNSFERPDRVAVRSRQETAAGVRSEWTFPALSLTVISVGAIASHR
jgi:alpha-N-arabinofuranosidase